MLIICQRIDDGFLTGVFMKYCITVLFLVFPVLSASASPLDHLKREIKKNGYILYRTPLAHSGTGTLVGGTPKAMVIAADPQRCFPDEINGQPTFIRKVEETNLGNISQTTSFEGKVGVDLIKFMNGGNSVFTIAAGGSVIQSIDLEFQGAKIEYLDTIALQHYYSTQMPAECKRSLEDYGFIIQALRVDQMRYAFKNKAGGYIKLNMDAVSQYLDINVDVKYHIEQDYVLVIDSPKYIGYQLGRLQEKDQGYALYRAYQTFFNRYWFRSSSIFQNAK